VVQLVVQSDNPERREQGVTYIVTVDDDEERDSCTCPAWVRTAKKSGIWEDVTCRHLRRIIRERNGW
jgi:hypothetical protein